MQTVALFFEIADKVIEVRMLYSLFLVAGGIGLLLGFWRWWISTIWLIFPLLSFFVLFHIVETYQLYDAIIEELGSSYIWHSYASITIGILLNVIGVFIRFFKTKKLDLQ